MLLLKIMEEVCAFPFINFSSEKQRTFFSSPRDLNTKIVKMWVCFSCFWNALLAFKGFFSLSSENVEIHQIQNEPWTTFILPISSSSTVVKASNLAFLFAAKIIHACCSVENEIKFRAQTIHVWFLHCMSMILTPVVEGKTLYNFVISHPLFSVFQWKFLLAKKNMRTNE